MSGLVENNLSGFIMHQEAPYETGIMATGDQANKSMAVGKKTARHRKRKP